MTKSSPQEVTQLLLAWSRGDQTALDLLVPLVHAELRRLARHYLRRNNPGDLLQTTALVNEAYLRLIDCGNVEWQGRAHFFAIAAQLMREVLVDYTRRHHARKRGASLIRVSLEEATTTADERGADLVALDDALESLAAIDPRKSRIIELRFFGGLSVKETAEVLKTSPRTVAREWDLARAWLYRELNKGGSDET
jgi:RNA polymerase sigma factor (TIGR02999 family)